MLLILFSYSAEAGIYLFQVLNGYSVQRNSIVHVISAILAWSYLSISLLVRSSQSWNHYLGSWILGCLFELIPWVFRGQFMLFGGNVSSVTQTFRLLCSASLVAHGYLANGKIPQIDEECQALLGNQYRQYSMPTLRHSPENLHQTSEESDDDKERDQHEKFKIGDWRSSLKPFANLIPHILPVKSRKCQILVAVLILELLATRLLNILTPQQLGIIITKLTDKENVWQDLAWWIAYRWLNSPAGLKCIKKLALLEINSDSQRALSGLAYEHLMTLSLDFQSSKDTGEVIKSVEQANSITKLLELVFLDLAPVVVDLIIAGWYVTKLFDITLAYIFFILGICYVWITASLVFWSQSCRRTYTKKSRIETSRLYESVSNWITVFYFNQFKFEWKRYLEAVQGTIRARRIYKHTLYFGLVVQNLILTFGLLGSSALAIIEIEAGQKPVGNFITLVTYWTTMTAPLVVLAGAYSQFSASLVDAERLIRLLNLNPSTKDGCNAPELKVTGGCIEFRDVSFSYSSSTKLMENVNFVAKPGETVALVGETGGGKSTILKLVYRLYDIATGSITIDGQNIRFVSQNSLRSFLGIVPQNPTLFNRSILENIRYARLDATDEEIYEACKDAAIHDKIMSFSEKYETKVGEGGIKLSGGELQRLGIARVLLKRPKIVLFDEATSSLDSSTETEIQKALQKLQAGRTTIVIAHRLSTVKNADMILVVARGKLVERGTHEMLLKEEGEYHKLWKAQTGGDE
jgi:ABC-type transport system involved in Fe-S cluster assembly fused permease/ATPase subunit